MYHPMVGGCAVLRFAMVDGILFEVIRFFDFLHGLSYCLICAAVVENVLWCRARDHSKILGISSMT